MPSSDASTPPAFSFTVTKDRRVFVRWRQRGVKILKGASAEKFLAAAASCDPEGVQLLLARLTGNFKRGNER